MSYTVSWKVWLFLLLCCHHTACKAGPDQRETIRELRVLAIKATPPENKPGEQVQLETLAVTDTQDPITYQWFLCPRTQEIEHGCHENPDATNLGNKAQATLTIPSTFLENITETEKVRGKDLAITLVVKSGQEQVIATKRVVVSNNPTNQNPQLDKIRVTQNGLPIIEPWPVQTKQTYTMQPQWPTNTRQTYTAFQLQGKTEAKYEAFFFSWYTTHGTFEKGYLTQNPTESNTWLAPAEIETNTTVTIYLILRDGRGGTSWMTQTLLLNKP